MLAELFFLYFAAAIVGLSLMVVTRKNPVHSVLWMLFLFFHIAGLYLFLNAELISAIQVIVYAGAILVLFLFVVLLLDLRKEIEEDRFIGSWPTGISIALGFFLLVSLVLPFYRSGAPEGAGIMQAGDATPIHALGRAIFTEYMLPFEVVSVILLVAVIGAILLAKKKIRE